MTDGTQNQATTVLNEALATGFETADFESLKGLYAEDAVLLPPRSRLVKGRQAIATFWTGVRNRFAGMSFTTTEWKPLGGEVAREIGTYEMAAGEGGGAQSTGKFVTVWQQIEGVWLIESSIWSRNTDTPAVRGGQGAQRGVGQRGGQGGAGQRVGQGGGQVGGGYRQAGSQGYGGQGGGGQGYGQGGGGGRNRGGIGGGAGIGGGGGAGVIGAGRRSGPGGGQRPGGQRGGQGAGQGQNRREQSLYEDNPGLYSNRDD